MGAQPKQITKYIILYGHNYSHGLYAIAKNITEAKQFVKECMEDNDISVSEVSCYEVKSKDISTKLTVTIK